MSTLRSNFNTPLKLQRFCDIEEYQKGEVTYEVWSFEVRCLINSQALLDAVLLKRFAGSLLLSLGKLATVNQILNRLKGVYGKVRSSETLLQEYYNDSQKEYEIIVALGPMVRIYTL